LGCIRIFSRKSPFQLSASGKLSAFKVILKPTVLIDGVAFENRNQIGIWRVFYETLSRLASEVEFYIVLERDPENQLPPDVRVIRSDHRRRIRRRSKYYDQWRRSRSNRALEKAFPRAIWHSTFFTVDPRSLNRSIIHLYDMVAEEFYYLSPDLEVQASLKRAALSTATAILSISETTTAQFRQFYPDKSDCVFTAALGYEHIKGVAGHAGGERRHCLFVGHRNSYKNFQAVVKAIGSPAWPHGVELNVVGFPFSDSESAFIAYHNATNRIHHLGKLTDDELNKAYQRSHALIFSSLGEGFGLPVLEAQASGCLPLLSDIPVFHEVAGDAALFFNPLDPQSLARAVSLSYSPQAESLRENCRSNVANFSWDTTAALTLKYYRQLSS
jgi:glycosyltransferase involved in cell wall biosynthesis